MKLSPRLLAPLALCAVLAPVRAAQADDAVAPPVARDLLSIARREAEREREQLATRVQALLAELRSTSDANLGFVQDKIKEVAAIGPAALPVLMQAMDAEGVAPGAVNVRLNSARAAAAIGGPAALEALLGLAEKGSRTGRLHAAYALGLLRDQAALGAVKSLLAVEDADLQRESLLALGSIGGDEAVAILRSYVPSPQPLLAAAAVKGLADNADVPSAGAVQTRLSLELAATPPAEVLLTAALAFVAAVPTEAALAAAEGQLRSETASPPLREAAVRAVRAIGLAFDSSRKAAVESLEVALGSTARNVVLAAAHALDDLGDDSGIKAVTAELDVELGRNPKNYTARYKRAELLLEFGEWRDAQRDLNEGLKVDRDLRSPDKVHLMMARAYAGMKRPSDAVRFLSKLPKGACVQLPTVYPEFAEMAGDERYAKLFQLADR